MTGSSPSSRSSSVHWPLAPASVCLGQTLTKPSACLASHSICLLHATGGGGLLVPIFVLFGGFRTRDAIPISKATIFGTLGNTNPPCFGSLTPRFLARFLAGGAIANLIVNYSKRHPLAPRPLVDC